MFGCGLEVYCISYRDSLGCIIATTTTTTSVVNWTTNFSKIKVTYAADSDAYLVYDMTRHTVRQVIVYCGMGVKGITSLLISLLTKLYCPILRSIHVNFCKFMISRTFTFPLAYFDCIGFCNTVSSNR